MYCTLKCNYRDAEVVRELSISEAPATNVAGKVRFAAGERGIAAVDGGDDRRVSGGSGDGVVLPVKNDGIVVGEIEEVLDDEMIAGGGLGVGMAHFRRELSVGVVPCRSLVELWIFHLRLFGNFGGRS